MPIFAQVKEFSIIDPIQEELDKELISDGKVIAEVRSKILSEVNKIAEKFDIVIKKVWIVGSSISYQYTPDSDIDVNVFIEPKSPEEMINLNSKIASEFNEKLFVEEHPVNFYLNTGRFYKFRSDAIYDLLSNKWVKKPDALSEKDVREVIDECSSLEEFTEILEKYTELKKMLDKFDQSDEQLTKIIKKALHLNNLFVKIRDKRREDYKKRPDKSLPSAAFRCSNVIFQLLQEHGLGDIAEDLAGFIKSRLKD